MHFKVGKFGKILVLETFFEQSANVELDSYVEPINEVNPQNNFLLLNEIEKINKREV